MSNEIPAGSSSDVSSCCKVDTTSGTEGVVDVYDDDIKVCTMSWNCPWGSGSNRFQILSVSHGYSVVASDWPSDGALGRITVNISKG